MHLVVLGLENKSQQPPDLNFVVDDQRDGIHLPDETSAAAVSAADASASTGPLADKPVATNSAAGSRIPCPMGKRMENIAPPPWRFCATISPPFTSINCRAIDKPRPRPPGRVRGPR